MRQDAIYARQSVEREDSLSIEGQLARCRFEARDGAREYIDRGFSGKNTNRPAFQRMMADIRAGEIEKVIVYRLDRISRSILDFAQMMELFAEKQVEFLSSTEHFDTSAPMGRAMLNICIVFAQLERETIQARVLDTYADRSRRGFYMGGRVPYGFALGALTLDGVHTACYVPVEAEAAVLRRMFAAYAQGGTTLGDLARLLDGEGVRNRRGQAWSTPRLSELLKNPVYCRADERVYDFFRAQGAEIINPPADFIGRNGCYLFRGNSPNKRADLQGTRLVLAPHEGLVDSDIWLACRRRLLGNRRAAAPSQGTSSWLCGRARCAACGRALTVARSKSAAGRYFVCPGKGKGCAGLPTIYAAALEHAAEERLLERAAAILDGEPADPSALRAQETFLMQRLDTFAERSLEASDALLRALERRAAQTERQLAAVRAAQEEAARRMQPLHSRWDVLTVGERGRIAAALMDAVQVEAQRVTIVWKC
ncbi:MAG: recombinase family protein [Butyricicoccus sp.]|nr:recombinase family protein [Butyricicoccus sp.]